MYFQPRSHLGSEMELYGPLFKLLYFLKKQRNHRSYDQKLLSIIKNQTMPR